MGPGMSFFGMASGVGETLESLKVAIMAEAISGPLSYLEGGKTLGPQALPHWLSGSDLQAYRSQ